MGYQEGGGELTCIPAAPLQDLIQEGSLVSGGQRDLPVTQLLSQAAVQQAQHHVVGGTGPLGERHTLWLCPTHTPLSNAANAPGSTLTSKALPSASAAPARSLAHSPYWTACFLSSEAPGSAGPLGEGEQPPSVPTSGEQKEEHLQELALGQQSQQVKMERDLMDTAVSSLVQSWEERIGHGEMQFTYLWLPSPVLLPCYTLSTDHLRPVPLGAQDSTPCSGTAVSGIRRSAGSLCRQHPVGGAGGETAVDRSHSIPAPTSGLKEVHRLQSPARCDLGGGGEQCVGGSLTARGISE